LYDIDFPACYQPVKSLRLTLVKIPFINNFRKYQNLIFVDVETTGLDPIRDRVIEVGAVRVDKKMTVSTYSQLVNPGFKIPPVIRKLTGIRIKDLATAPSFAEVIKDLQAVFKADLFIAHNSKFDYDFLSEEFARFELELGIPHLDTIRLARSYYPNYLTYNLDSIISRLKLPVQKRHRGLDDANVLWALFQKISSEFGEDDLHKTIEKLVTIPKKRKFTSQTQRLLF